MKFRKKPVVIEATQFDGTRESAKRIGLNFNGQDDTGRDYFSVSTLEGQMRASPNDWIITGVKGERYPCKPDIFEATYEYVREEGGEASCG